MGYDLKRTDVELSSMQPRDPAQAVVADSTSQPDSVSVPHRMALLLLLVAGLAVRLWCLACKPFWFDECFSVEVARIDWRNLLHLLWWREANMSLYYVLLRIWLHLGQSPFFIRSLSVLISVATLPAIYWVARLLYDRRVALIAAALFAFNAYDIRYAQEARSYALFVLLATISSGFLIAWVRQSTREHRIGYVISSILAAYAHFYALLLIVAHWLVLLWRRGSDARESAARGMRRAWIAIGVGVLPLLTFVAKTGAGPIKWIQRPGLHDLLNFYEYLAGGSGWTLLAMYAVACGVAIGPRVPSLLKRSQNWETWRCQFLLLWMFFPVALTVLLSFARPVFLPRYMIFTLPAFLVLAAAGIARLRQGWLLGAALIMVLLPSSQGISFVYAHDFDSERDASGAAANFILDHTQPGDAIVFHIAEARIPFEFYRSLRAGENTASPKFTAPLGPEILFPHHEAGLDYRDFTGKPTPEFLRSATPGHPRIWVMLMNNGPAGKPDPTTVMLTQVLSESFPGTTRWEFSRVEVLLFSRR
jgi:mannosyltransferase